MPSPVVIGFFRPLILLPDALSESLADEELKMVLMHELAHVRRFDNLTLFVQRLVEAAFFFHPVVWLGGRNLRSEAERACDDLVRTATGKSEQYANGLARVAEFSFTRNRISQMNVFAAVESDLTHRIRRALNERVRRMSRPSRAVAGMGVAAIALFSLPSGMVDSGRAAEEEEQVRVVEKRVKKIIADGDTITMSDAMPNAERDSLEIRLLREGITTPRVIRPRPIPPIHPAPVCYYTIAKLTTNPAGTNGERFVVLDVSLVIADAEGADLSRREMQIIKKRMGQFLPPTKAEILRIMRSATVDDYDGTDGADRLARRMRDAVRKQVVERYVADAVPGRKLVLEEVLISELIIQ